MFSVHVTIKNSILFFILYYIYLQDYQKKNITSALHKKIASKVEDRTRKPSATASSGGSVFSAGGGGKKKKKKPKGKKKK